MEEKLVKFLLSAGGSYKPKAELKIETLASSHRVRQFLLFNGSIYVNTPGLLFHFLSLSHQTREELFGKLSKEIFFDRNLF